MFKKKIFIFILLLTSCAFNEVEKTHGITNLKNKIQLIKYNKTNKNDIIKILGQSIIIDQKENTWSYFEVRKKTSKLGKKKIIINDYAEIKFNKYELVTKVTYFTSKDRKALEFSKDKTRTLAINDTFMKNLFSSTRERLKKLQENRTID